MSRLFPLFLLSWLWAGVAGAQLPGSPQAYDARVPVADQNAATRDTALREALRQVVTRISGDDAVYAAADLISQAPQLVQHYGYERDAEFGLMLVAGFDGRAVEQRLKAKQLPVWGVYAAAVEDVVIQVSGIQSAEAYIRLLSLVRGVAGVQDVKPEQATGDTLQLRVRAEGGAGRLSGGLMGAYELQQDPQGSAPLSYRYVASTYP